MTDFAHNLPGISKSTWDFHAEPTHPTRVWCTSDDREMTVVQDGAAGINVLTVPIGAVIRQLVHG